MSSDVEGSMGIFSRFFNNTPTVIELKDNWQGIDQIERMAINISSGLEEVRKQWYESWLNILKTERINSNKPDGRSNNASHSIKAFQLYHTTHFVRKRQYIVSPCDVFGDRLHFIVCGDERDECLKYVRKYDELKTNISDQGYEFALDISSSITGESRQIMQFMPILITIPNFVSSCQMVAAIAFNDKKELKRIEKQIDKG